MHTFRGGLGWILGSKFFSGRLVRYWHRLPGVVQESPSLEVLKEGEAIVIRDVI